MKRLAGMACVWLLAASSWPVAAEEPAKAASSNKAAADAASPASLAKLAEASIRGSVWAMTLTPIGGDGKAAAMKDKVSFDGGKILSDRLSAAGYPASNYTLTVGDDKIPVWETMQSAGEKGVAFWRGELHGESMRGILSEHPTDGAASDYSFSATKTGDAAKIPEVKPISTPTPATEPAVPADVSAPAQPQAASPGVPSTPVPAVTSTSSAVVAPVTPGPAAPAEVQPATPSTPAASTQAPDASTTGSKKRNGWLW